MARDGCPPGLRGSLCVLLLALLVACERKPEPPPTPELHLTPARFEDLPGWSIDDQAAALPALRRSCARLAKLPDDRQVGRDGIGGTAADWRQACDALVQVPGFDTAATRAVLEDWFRPFAASDRGEAEGLFTGYYEAELNGSLAADQRHRTPLYARPDDLVGVTLRDFDDELPRRRLLGRVANGHLVPYFSRAEIDGGALAGRGLELLWVDDPVDAFFLHIQGSGRVRLPDGSTRRVGFAASNGRPFTAIGRRLLESGAIDRDKASMQSIRSWLRANPAEATTLMHSNERFIFFRLIEGEGPIGAEGVALTDGRSLAVDPGFLPLGAPLWLDTTWPASERPLQRLMVAQDSGSAIKGPVRGDFFWGTGEPALAEAGRMKQRGRYWLLLPKSVADRRSAGS